LLLYSWLSCIFSHVLNVVQMVVIIVSVFLYGRLYLALSGLEFAIMKQARMRGNRALQAAILRVPVGCLKKNGLAEFRRILSFAHERIERISWFFIYRLKVSGH